MANWRDFTRTGGGFEREGEAGNAILGVVVRKEGEKGGLELKK